MLKFEMKDWQKRLKDLAIRESKWGKLYIMGKPASGKTTLVKTLETFGIEAKEVYPSHAGFIGDLTRLSDTVRMGQIVYLEGHYKGENKLVTYE